VESTGSRLYQVAEKRLIERIPYEIIKTSKVLKIFTDLKFAILVLTILAIASSLGSFIEQDESVSSTKL
jgi:hypothetical protein